MVIKGITITIIVKEQNGVDGFGKPIYIEREEAVDNVLVQPLSSEDSIAELSLTGKHILYNLAIPKGDNHKWESTEVKFFGKTFRTVGIPVEGIEAMLPLAWNKKVKCELYE